MNNLEVFENIRKYQKEHPNDYFNSQGTVSLAGILEYFDINLILNNYIVNELGYDSFIIENDYNDKEIEELEIFQYYIVDNHQYEFLKTHFPDLFVYMYHHKADLCLLGVEHFGTSWRGVSVSKDEFKGWGK